MYRMSRRELEQLRKRAFLKAGPLILKVKQERLHTRIEFNGKTVFRLIPDGSEHLVDDIILIFILPINAP